MSNTEDTRTMGRIKGPHDIWCGVCGYNNVTELYYTGHDTISDRCDACKKETRQYFDRFILMAKVNDTMERALKVYKGLQEG